METTEILLGLLSIFMPVFGESFITVHCPTIVLKNGQVKYTDLRYGGEAQVQCSRGFYYDDPDNAIRYCLSDGVWSGKDGHCKEIECPLLPNPKNGTVQLSNRSYLSKAIIQCNLGYVYTKPESLTRICQENGAWSGEEGTCQSNHCDPHQDVTNGYVSSVEGHFVDVRILQCAEGYILNGPGRALCQLNGIWAPRLGKCIPNRAKDHFLWIAAMCIVFGMLAFLLIAFLLQNKGFFSTKSAGSAQQPQEIQPVLEEMDI